MSKLQKVDSRWRIMLPREAREFFKPGDLVLVEVVSPGQVLIRKAMSPEELVKKIKSTKLSGSKESINIDAAKIKDEIRGFKE